MHFVIHLINQYQAKWGLYLSLTSLEMEEVGKPLKTVVGLRFW